MGIPSKVIAEYEYERYVFEVLYGFGSNSYFIQVHRKGRRIDKLSSSPIVVDGDGLDFGPSLKKWVESKNIKQDFTDRILKDILAHMVMDQ